MDKSSAPPNPPQSVSAGTDDQITEVRGSSNRVSVESTHKLTTEEAEDSGWEELEEAIESDEEGEDGNESGGPARFHEKMDFLRVEPKEPSGRSLLTILIHKDGLSLVESSAQKNDQDLSAGPFLNNSRNHSPPDVLTESLREAMVKYRNTFEHPSKALLQGKKISCAPSR